MSEQNPSDRAPRSLASPDEDFASMLEASLGGKKSTGAKAPRRPVAGDLISCKVIAVGASSVFVSVGEKAEGTIDIAEFRDPATGEIRVQVGDSVQATIVDDGGTSGSAVLTRMLGRGGHASAELQQAHDLGVPVEGLVKAETKGGYEVMFGAVRAFCPGSQIDLRRGERVPASAYVGQRFPFRVTKVDNEGRNVVVSRRMLLEEAAAEEAARTWEKIVPGAVLEGTVRSIRDFGAFVDLGGVDGMVHVSELGYTRVKNPGEVLSIGQKVRVQVMKVGDPDKDGRRQIGLSMRALAEDPWSTVGKTMPVGTSVAGVVRRVEPYGAFVEVMPGVEGLVHISKITAERRLQHARQGVDVGQSVQVTVVGFDPAQRRLSLSMIEETNRAREAEAAEEKGEQQRVMAAQKSGSSLGTFADLLDAARRK
jgi:small subunit ribosomal protein S1